MSGLMLLDTIKKQNITARKVNNEDNTVPIIRGSRFQVTTDIATSAVNPSSSCIRLRRRDSEFTTREQKIARLEIFYASSGIYLFVCFLTETNLVHLHADVLS